MNDVREWHPGASTILAMNAIALAAFVAALIGYLIAWSSASGDSTFEVAGSDLVAGILVSVVLTLGLMVVHELIHGLVVRACGARPVYGAAIVGKILPVFYCTAPGSLFTRSQFMAIALAPIVVLTPLLGVLVAVLPFGGWLVVPAAVLFAGSIGDLWMTAIVARQPAGTRVEDLKSGMRFHDASRQAVPDSDPLLPQA